MYAPKITPLSGKSFENFLDLVLHDVKSPEYHKAWKKVQQDIKLFIKHPDPLDLNQLFVDLMTLKILAFPILEASQHPLKPNEWEPIAEALKSIEERCERVNKRMLQMKKKDPKQALELQPLVDQLFPIRNTMQTYWKTYQEEWQKFQFEDPSEEETKSSSETPAPGFNRAAWHVLQTGFKALVSELSFRAKHNKTVSTIEDVVEYPLLPLLVREIRTLADAAQGFELLEKVKIVQSRNKQLALRLQFLYGETPVLPEKEKAILVPPKPNSSTASKSTSTFSWSDHRKKLLWLLPLALVLVLVFWLAQNNSSPTRQPPMSGLKGSSLAGPLGSKSNNQQNTSNLKKDLESLQSSQNTSIPIRELSSQIKEQLESVTGEVSDALLKEITEDLKEMMVILADETTAFLVSGESLERFDTFAELRDFLDAIQEQVQKVLELANAVQAQLTQYDVSVSMARNENEPTFALVLRDKNNHIVGKIGLHAQGLALQWKDMKNSLVVQNPSELAQAIKDLESSQ